MDTCLYHNVMKEILCYILLLEYCIINPYYDPLYPLPQVHYSWLPILSDTTRHGDKGNSWMYNSARFVQCTVYNKLYKRLHSLGRSRHDHMYQELPVMGHKVFGVRANLEIKRNCIMNKVKYLNKYCTILRTA